MATARNEETVFSCSPVAVGSSLVGVDGSPVGSNHPLHRGVLGFGAVIYRRD